MTLLIALGWAVLLVMVIAGIHNLQSWLERCDYERHFED